jgi:alkylation response protein AidB-like acyl-CoA dehydrogenase
MHAKTKPATNHAAIAAARELLPLITRLREQTETDRRIAAPIVEALRDKRLCRMQVVESLQGLELPPPDELEVYEALSSADASVGWIVWNNALPCQLSRYLTSAAREELFGEPKWLFAISTRSTGRAAVEGNGGRGGYRLNGRWSLVSGCELAEWIGLMCIVEENGEPRMVQPGVPELRVVFVRRGHFHILDTWHVSGLRGTGSHDVVVTDKRVPRRLTLSLSDPCTIDAPIGRVPIISVAAAGYAAQCLGVAQTTLDTLVELTKTKPSIDTGPRLGDRPAVHAAITRQAAALEAARRYLRKRVTDIWDKARARATPNLEDIGAVWGAAHHAVDVARSTVDVMHAAGGTTSIYTDCPIERAHRDMHAMTRHIVAQPLWIEDAGRVALGMPPNHPLFAI